MHCQGNKTKLKNDFSLNVLRAIQWSLNINHQNKKELSYLCLLHGCMRAMEIRKFTTFLVHGNGFMGPYLILVFGMLAICSAQAQGKEMFFL